MARQQPPQQRGGRLGILRRHRDAGQVYGRAAVAVSDQQPIGTGDLQNLCGLGGQREQEEGCSPAQQRRQAEAGGRQQREQRDSGSQSLVPQLGQKKWALSVVSPQALH